MTYDFTKLEEVAAKLRERGRHSEALRIYLYMADGDASLDGGYLGEQIAACYEAVGDIDEARYWYGRATGENSGARVAATEARARLGPIVIADLL